MAVIKHPVFFTLLLVFWKTEAQTESVRSNCTAPEAYLGEPADVTCTFSKDLNVTKKDFKIYRQSLNSAGNEEMVFDCFWREKDQLECKNLTLGYRLGKNVSRQIVFTILKASPTYVYRYKCRADPSYPGDSVPCVFKLKETPSTVVNSGSTPGARDHTANKQDDGNIGLIVGLVLGCAFLVTGAAVIFFIRRRRKQDSTRQVGRPEDVHNGADKPFLRDSPEELASAEIHEKDETRPDADNRSWNAEEEKAADEFRDDGIAADCLCALSLRQTNCRLLIIGKAGSGKSTLGNMLLGHELFATGSEMFTTTKETEIGKAKDGPFQVMDTPDICNNDMEKATQEEEVSKWKEFMSRCNGAILLAVRCHEDYSNHDYIIYKQMKSLWGDSFCQRLVVAFTFGDKLGGDSKELATKASPKLKLVLKDVGNRFVVFNKMADPGEREQMFSTLLSLVDNLGHGVSAPGAHAVASDAGIPDGPKHIVLLMGKTGNGRSSVGNTLLGIDGAFETGCGMSSTTTEVQVKETARFKAVDTPDISDTEYNDKQRKVAVLKWKELTAPGPHAILLTVRCDVRYTAEEYDIYKQLKKLWGDAESFCRRLVVAFTFGDRQDGSIEEELKGSIPQELKNVLGDAGHRYVVFNNRAKPDDNKEAVNKLADIVWTIRQQNETERCLIVVGKTGNGRSSVGNTLLGKDEFETGCGMSSTTTEPKAATSEQPKIKVVDTPDISDNDHFTDKQRKEQLSLWKRLAAPGPHAILLTVRCDVRYTAEEYDIYKQLKTLWGDSFCKLLIVAFTFGDRQDADIEEELKSSVPVELKNVLKDANGRYVVFDNRAEPGEEFKTVNRLLDIVDKLSKTRSATGPRSRP